MAAQVMTTGHGVLGTQPATFSLICRALTGHGVPVAARTFWARRSRPLSEAALWDAAVTEILAGIYEPDDRGRRVPESLWGR